MKRELKHAIVKFIFDNEKYFQLQNSAIKNFRLYIYDDKGEYLIGGEEVKNFIERAINLLTND